MIGRPIFGNDGVFEMTSREVAWKLARIEGLEIPIMNDIYLVHMEPIKRNLERLCNRIIARIYFEFR